MQYIICMDVNFPAVFLRFSRIIIVFSLCFNACYDLGQ